MKSAKFLFYLFLAKLDRSLLSSMGGVDSVGGVGLENFGVCDVGQNFGVGGMGLMCFVKKGILKSFVKFTGSTCAGVSC